MTCKIDAEPDKVKHAHGPGIKNYGGDQRGIHVDESPEHFRHLVRGSLSERPSYELRSPALDLAVQYDVSAEEGPYHDAVEARTSAAATRVYIRTVVQRRIAVCTP